MIESIDRSVVGCLGSDVRTIQLVCESVDDCLMLSVGDLCLLMYPSRFLRWIEAHRN